MTEHISFHFHEHPVIALVLMICFLSGSLMMNFVDYAHAIVPFAQIAACGMTVVVGLITLKKLNAETKKNK